MGKRWCSTAIARVTKRRRWIKCAAFLSFTRVPVTEKTGSIGKDRSGFVKHRRTRWSARERRRQVVREGRRTPRRARSGTGKAGPVRQAGEEGGKRTRAEGEEDRRVQRAEGKRAEGTGRQSRVIKPAATRPHDKAGGYKVN